MADCFPSQFCDGVVRLKLLLAERLVGSKINGKSKLKDTG